MKVLLAVSGGIDSMYMLHRAPELFPGASFAVAHCNFCLRGSDSDGDEAFVRDACSRLGVECFVNRFDTLGYSAEHGVSVEMAARELRYGWFASLCAGHGFDALATAHNANDNAETLILNLLRGTGTRGLRGIEASRVLWSSTTIPLHPQGTGGVPPETPCVASLHYCIGGTKAGIASEDRGRPWPPRRADVPWGTAGGNNISERWEGPTGCDRTDGACSDSAWKQTVGGMSEAKSFGGNSRGVQPGPPEIVRPLLMISREEIRKWMESNGKSWREDRTNAENEAKRNKIRNQVFPVFAEINPSFIRTLGADMDRIRQTDDIAEDYYREAAGRIVKEADGTVGISVPGLLELKHWRYVLWRILEDCSFSAETFDKLCTLLERYRTEPSGTVTLSGKKFEAPRYILRARKKNLILQLREA